MLLCIASFVEHLRPDVSTGVGLCICVHALVWSSLIHLVPPLLAGASAGQGGGFFPDSKLPNAHNLMDTLQSSNKTWCMQRAMTSCRHLKANSPGCHGIAVCRTCKCAVRHEMHQIFGRIPMTLILDEHNEPNSSCKRQYYADGMLTIASRYLSVPEQLNLLTHNLGAECNRLQ